MNPPPSFQEAAAEFESRMAKSPLIRAVNFHNTSRARSADYARQLEHLSRSFSPVNEKDLDAYLATGKWAKSKPGIIVSVYEGYRNGYDVLRPLLDRYGLIGWFFVITGFVNASPSAQLAFAEGHEIEMTTHEYADGRYALSWSELQDLDRTHVIACHGRSHTSLAPMAQSSREQEIVGTQRDFEQHLGHPVRSFCSYGGPPFGSDPLTDQLILQAGYQFVFSNLRIQRIRRLNLKTADRPLTGNKENDEKGLELKT